MRYGDAFTSVMAEAHGKLVGLARSIGDRGHEMLDRLLRFAYSRGITVRFVDKCRLTALQEHPRAPRSKSEPPTRTSPHKQQPSLTRSRTHCCTGLLTGARLPRVKASPSTNSNANLRPRQLLTLCATTLASSPRQSFTSRPTALLQQCYWRPQIAQASIARSVLAQVTVSTCSRPKNTFSSVAAVLSERVSNPDSVRIRAEGRHFFPWVSTTRGTSSGG